MIPAFRVAFLVLAGITLLQSLVSLWRGLAWLRFVRKYRSPSESFLPPVTVIVPCCGLEPGLAGNLAAYLQQDYPDYEALFVTGGDKDAAAGVVEACVKSQAHARAISSGPSSGEGDKIAKLRRAVAEARAESRVLAFADSDGRPGRQWLRSLVAPLADPSAGAATGYRWYVAGGGLATLIRSVWDSFILSLLGNHNDNFCWGGSMAVRRETFRSAQVEECWRGSVSDDYQLTRALRRLKLRIVFVPMCLVENSTPCGWRELFTWTTRQIVITRVYAPRLWAIGLGSHGVYGVTLIGGLILAFFWPPAAVLLVVALLPGIVKGAVRATGAAAMLPGHAAGLSRLRPVYALLAAVIPLLMLYNFLAAAFIRSIEWRGVRYELLGPNQTRVLVQRAPLVNGPGAEREKW